jgi:hypothetical protein
MWPHKLTVNGAVYISAIVCGFELVLLAGGAYLDCSWILPGSGIGLLHHPGIVSVVFGDAILFVLCAKCIRLTSRIGKRIPANDRSLVLRFFHQSIWRNVFDGERYFIKLFSFMSLIGFISLVNQSIKLGDPHRYYHHDTFDSMAHVYSFIANRINLFTSWCIVIPIFFSYLIIHIVSLRNFVVTCRRHRLLSFYIRHPDKSGGYAFFGVANTIYMIGLAVILIEIFLLIYTHQKIDISNVIPLSVVSCGFVLVSIFSIYEINKTLKQMEKSLKARAFAVYSKANASIDLYYYVLNYGIRFSAYNYVSAKIMLLLRIGSFLPTSYKLLQYSKTFF